MNVDTKVFLGKRFKKYYWKNPAPAPTKVDQREFGVGTLEDKIKFRHKSFSSEKEVADFLRREAPYYISYSTAYYEFPANQPMATKNWKGADLVFDLDHEIKYLSNVELENVKEQTINLRDFLEEDLGFSTNEMKMNFSGSKGYHLHVMTDSVYQLTGDERRELVDYVTGEGLKVKYFIEESDSPDGIMYRHGPKPVSSNYIGPHEGDTGWAKRIYDVTYEFVSSSQEDLEAMKGIGPKKASQIVEDSDRNVKSLKSGMWDGLVDISDKLQERIIREKSIAIRDADKMVTIDTARLIRLPDTLHGGSGLKAATFKSIESFNPLVDAVVFTDEEVNVKFNKNVPKFEIMEQTLGEYKKDSVEKIPEYAAVYLMLKGAVEAA